MQKLKIYFPSSKEKWKQYSKIFWPVILGSTLFALNGFIDNFMVGRYNGVTSVSVANQWTNIVMGFVIGTSAAGGIIASQLYFSGKYESFRALTRFRIVFNFSIALVFAVLAWTMPDKLNGVFLKEPSNNLEELDNYQINLKMAREYLRVIAIQWLFISLSGNLGDQLREIGHGKITMYWGIGTLAINMFLNWVLIYHTNIGVSGAAIASVVARIVALIIGITYIIKKKLELRFNILTIFSMDWQIVKLFFSKFTLFFSYSTMIALVTFRNYFYDLGYPQGSLGPNVGAAAVLGLSNAILNVFTTMFSAIGVMTNNFVGSQLGNNNIDQAKSNAKELRGFHLLMSLIFVGGLIISAFLLPSMKFLVRGENVSQITQEKQLVEARNALFVLLAFYPLWIWTTTVYRIGVSGGKVFWFSFGDWFLNCIQIGWAFIVMIPIKDNFEFLHSRFWLSYLIFFCYDFLKVIWHETAIKLVDWAQVIETKSTILVDELNLNETLV